MQGDFTSDIAVFSQAYYSPEKSGRYFRILVARGCMRGFDCGYPPDGRIPNFGRLGAFPTLPKRGQSYELLLHRLAI